MPIVHVSETEPFDVALRRFKRVCEKAGILGEVRRKERYVKPTKQRQQKMKAAVKRYQKKLSKENMSMQGVDYTKRLKTVFTHTKATAAE